MKVYAGLLIIFLMLALDSQAQQKKSSTKTKVENLRIDKEHSNAWAVKGMIRNISSSPIRGGVKIKFLSSKGDILHSFSAYVNDGDPINPNQAGPFKYYTKPSNFSDVVRFDVVFSEL